MFGDNMKKLRRTAGISQTEIAKMVHVSGQAVSKWETNRSTPSPEMIAKIAKILNVSTDDLLGGNPSTSAAIRIPVLGSVPAGIPLEAIEDVIGWEELPAAMAAGGREFFALQVQGDSMYPEYLSGDIVIVRKQDVADTGDDAIVYVNGYDATLKRVVFEGDTMTLRPINPQYPPRTFTAEEIKVLPVSIAGVVVELRRYDYVLFEMWRDDS